MTMRPLKYKTILNLILIFSVFSILFAFYIEYILGHKPCNLCLLQRLPYIASIILIVLVLIFKNLEKIASINPLSSVLKTFKSDTRYQIDEQYTTIIIHTTLIAPAYSFLKENF